MEHTEMCTPPPRYQLGEPGRAAAVELAERLGDYRTRIQHWLRHQPVRPNLTHMRVCLKIISTS